MRSLHTTFPTSPPKSLPHGTLAGIIVLIEQRVNHFRRRYGQERIQATQTMDSPPASLLSLPPEVRLKIYDHVFDGLPKWTRNCPIKSIEPAELLLVCRVVRYETSERFHGFVSSRLDSLRKQGKVLSAENAAAEPESEALYLEMSSTYKQLIKTWDEVSELRKLQVRAEKRKHGVKQKTTPEEIFAVLGGL